MHLLVNKYRYFSKSIDLWLALILLLVFFSCSEERYNKIIDMEFKVSASVFNRKDSAPDFKAMLSSFSAKDNIYIMTFNGNFDELISYHHKQIMQYFENQDNLKRESVNCSLFKYRDNTGHVFFGRNFDNRNTDVLIGLFIPDSGYLSIGFVPMTEFKFDEDNPFDPTLDKHRNLLLHSAAVTVDGINEKGVVVSVASISKQDVSPDSTKSYRFLLHLKRNILDHASDVSSAIDIASDYNVFDNSLHHIEHHILIADSSGRSAVLEWHDGRMQVIENNHSWQIVTNTKMYGMTDDQLSRQCNRFRRIYSELKNTPDTLTWQQSMDMLAGVKQIHKTYYFDSGPMVVSTQWSAVFDINERVLFVCKDRQYSKVYGFRLHNKEYYNNHLN